MDLLPSPSPAEPTQKKSCRVDTQARGSERREETERGKSGGTWRAHRAVLWDPGVVLEPSERLVESVDLVSEASTSSRFLFALLFRERQRLNRRGNLRDGDSRFYLVLCTCICMYICVYTHAHLALHIRMDLSVSRCAQTCKQNASEPADFAAPHVVSRGAQETEFCFLAAMQNA